MASHLQQQHEQGNPQQHDASSQAAETKHSKPSKVLPTSIGTARQIARQIDWKKLSSSDTASALQALAQMRTAEAPGEHEAWMADWTARNAPQELYIRSLVRIIRRPTSNKTGLIGSGLKVAANIAAVGSVSAPVPFENPPPYTSDAVMNLLFFNIEL
ncbi:hypothetical protein HKX48_006924 [Thoreauomyces humboldtii]|nr:hypothetical protein HKX48_006924 [Thoreauomyces humboldtii]